VEPGRRARHRVRGPAAADGRGVSAVVCARRQRRRRAGKYLILRAYYIHT
jgi:hypothetical protein